MKWILSIFALLVFLEDFENETVECYENYCIVVYEYDVPYGIEIYEVDYYREYNYDSDL